MIVSDLLIKQLGIAHEKYLAPMVQRTARQPGKLEIVGSTPRGVNQNFSFLSVLFCFLAFLMRPEWSKQVLVSCNSLRMKFIFPSVRVAAGLGSTGSTVPPVHTSPPNLGNCNVLEVQV